MLPLPTIQKKEKKCKKTMGKKTHRDAFNTPKKKKKPTANALKRGDLTLMSPFILSLDSSVKLEQVCTVRGGFIMTSAALCPPFVNRMKY